MRIGLPRAPRPIYFTTGVYEMKKNHIANAFQDILATAVSADTPEQLSTRLAYMRGFLYACQYFDFEDGFLDDMYISIDNLEEKYVSWHEKEKKPIA